MSKAGPSASLLQSAWRMANGWSPKIWSAGNEPVLPGRAGVIPDRDGSGINPRVRTGAITGTVTADTGGMIVTVTGGNPAITDPMAASALK